MSRRPLFVLLAALAAAPSFGAPLVEVPRLQTASVLAAPAAASVLPSAALMAGVSAPALTVTAPAPAAAAVVAANFAEEPSARTTAGVAARVAQAARAWGAPLEKIFQGHDVLLVGENHDSLESVETLTREMPRLAAAGVKAIGIEGLKRPHQRVVDAYVFKRSARIPQEALMFSPRRLEAFRGLLSAARRSGVRVVALGLPLDYWAEETARLAARNTGEPAQNFSVGTAAQLQRAQSRYVPGFNEAVAEVYLNRRNSSMADFMADALRTGGKAVILVGQTHVDGIDMAPGHLLNAPGAWTTLAGELTKRAMRAFSLTQTGGKFVDEDSEDLDRRARPLSYRAADAAAPSGAPAFVPLGDSRGLWHAGPATTDQ